MSGALRFTMNLYWATSDRNELHSQFYENSQDSDIFMCILDGQHTASDCNIATFCAITISFRFLIICARAYKKRDATAKTVNISIRSHQVPDICREGKMHLHNLSAMIVYFAHAITVCGGEKEMHAIPHMYINRKPKNETSTTQFPKRVIGVQDTIAERPRTIYLHFLQFLRACT